MEMRRAIRAAHDGKRAGTNHVMDARLRRALELRLHELQRRLPARLTPRDRRELAGLKELLKQPQKGSFDG
jgi:hypothetical protein